MNIEKLPINKDERGDLLPIDFFTDILFEPVRLFYITNAPKDTIRGEHGHFNCRQYYICVKGIIEVNTFDGINEKTITLTQGQSIFINKMVWSSEKFCTGNDVLLVLCSDRYNAEDYFNDKSILHA